MMKIFPLKEKTLEFELGFGCYEISLTGGWYIQNLDELDISLINIKTSKNINLKSKDFFGLRKQDFINRQQAVVAFSFDILEYSYLKLIINNPEYLIMKRYHPCLFIHNFLFGRTIPIEDINVVIK